LALPELHRKWRPALAAGAAALVAVLAAGCGATGESQADLVNGKRLFIGEGTCGTCHTLARAGTQATQGPNLDEAFANARDNGFGESAIYGVVLEQIAHPRRASVMKPGLVKGDDARDVAAYVAEVAGEGGEDSGVLASVQPETGSKKPARAQNGTLEIPAAEAGLAFEFSKAVAEPGQLTINMPNPASIDHNIAIEGGPEGPVVGGGGTSTIELNAKPGKYDYLCTVPGHAEGGMVGVLQVK
jgi:plastocyanin